MKQSLLLLSLLCSFAASCQTITISGKIINEERYPVPNATIRIKNTDRSAMADNNGYFTFANINISDTLIVSAIGYETTEQFYTGNSMITVTLKRKITALDEVIVNTG